MPCDGLLNAAVFGQLKPVMDARELQVFLKSLTRPAPGHKEALLAELRVARRGDGVRALVESRFNESVLWQGYLGMRTKACAQGGSEFGTKPRKLLIRIAADFS